MSANGVRSKAKVPALDSRQDARRGIGTFAFDLTPLESRLAVVVAATLRVSVDLVHPDTPFTLLGMDSLAAVELTSAINDSLGMELPTSAAHEWPDVGSLARFIETGVAPIASKSTIDQMRADAVLPDDIVPSHRAPQLTRDASDVLLTGATGFVGAHLLRALLDECAVNVHCLVRGADAAQRVRANLDRYGLRADDVTDRVRIVNGDLTQPMLGLSDTEYDMLARRIGAIYHGGASVNWVQGYDALRDANVIGTREILRLACHDAATPVHFLSSLGVCYSTQGPETVDETTDVFAFADGLNLGYAQSKCVAEELVRAAGGRGLPVTIVRPALVSGHSTSGVSNTDDLLARFMAGCIRMRAAPDLDWRMDCVPVDHVARSVVALSRDHQQGINVAHLANSRARHWRECVLWMRLCGYDIELVPYREWMRVLGQSAVADHPLHALRSFFLHGLASEGHLTMPELYEESRRSQARCERTDSRLAAAGLNCPVVDTAMLGRYFDEYVKDGLVPEASQRRRSATEARALEIDSVIPALEESLRRERDDASLRVVGLSLQPLGGDESIVGELTSWRHSTTCGLFRCAAEIETASGRETLPLFVKAKAADEHVLDVAQCVAALASPALGEAYARFRGDIGFTHSQRRELALYAHPDERLRRNSPRAYVVERDDEAQRWVLVLESVTKGVSRGDAEGAEAWQDRDIDAALRGLAEIHAVWYERVDSLAGVDWLPTPRPAARMKEMTPLWIALANHARDRSPLWREGDLADIHEQLAAKLDWAEAIDAQPATLIHNDFNPRNIVIRESGGKRRLCAYDWELARIGIPQRDLAELLCFVLSATVSRETVARWLERSRELLQNQTNRAIDANDWQLGFRASLCDLLVDRLAMYAMVSRFRPQRFLLRVMRTWQTLHQHFPWR